MLDIVNAVLSHLALAAGSSLGIFVLAVAADNVLGVAKAHFKDHNFDRNKLGSFLDSQFGTSRFKVVVLAGAAAGGSALLAALTVPASAGHIDILFKITMDAALGVMTAGALANLAAVTGDARDKLLALFK